jgi:RimJ/RimL family protein N-acetyltransferase
MFFETQRLKIRKFRSEDWLPLYELAMKWETSEYANYDHGPWPDDQEKYKEIVNDLSTSDNLLAVTLKETDEFIGFVAKAFKENGEYGLGFNFHPRFHGNGYAFEACSAIVQYIFEKLNAKQITDGTALVNKPAYNLLEKLGFKAGDHKKISFRQDRNGNPIEFTGVDFSLTREEYFGSVKEKIT